MKVVAQNFTLFSNNLFKFILEPDENVRATSMFNLNSCPTINADPVEQKYFDKELNLPIAINEGINLKCINLIYIIITFE